MNKLALYVTVFVRLALAAGFLSAVADRFGGWGASGQPGVAWGNWDAFVAYTGQLTSWLVTAPGLIQGLAVLSTALEIGFGLLLIVGYQTRYTALASGLLLLSFAVSMTFSALSPKVPLDYSVFSASAAAFLLATANRYPLSIDTLLVKDSP